MSQKHINCVIDTNNKKERELLLNYFGENESYFISNIEDYDDFQLVSVTFSSDIVALLVASSYDSLIKKGYMHFSSVDEYIAFVGDE